MREPEFKQSKSKWRFLGLAFFLCFVFLISCGHEPVNVPDFVFCGWEGAAGGPNSACACAHTISTDISVVHYDLDTCISMLQGSVFTQGDNFNTMQKNLDTLCAEAGSCNYQTAQQIKAISEMLGRILNVNPKK